MGQFDRPLPISSPHPLFDWSIHDTARISSLTPLTWLKSDVTCEWDGMDHIISSTTTTSTPSHATRFHSALRYYQHPSQSHAHPSKHPARQPILEAMNKNNQTWTPIDQTCIMYMAQRWIQWEQVTASGPWTCV